MLETGNKKLINAWAIYDWANSVFPLVITSTIFPIYYETITAAHNNGIVQIGTFNLKNTVLYDYVISLSFLLVAIISPLLSGIADISGKKKLFMQIFCYLGAFACSCMLFFQEGTVWVGLLCLFLSSIGFSGSLVFYNAFLPEIADPADQDRISAKGYIMGYIGSTILLIIVLTLIMFPEWYGLPDGGLPIRIGFLLTGIWWMAFAQYTFKYLPDNVYNKPKSSGSIMVKGYRELVMVWKELKTNKQIKKYLLSFFIFNMAVQTVMYVAALFGKSELKLSSNNLIISILIIQFIGIFGSYLFAEISKIRGNIFSLAVSIIIWIGICIGAYFIQEKTPWQFYLLGSFVGLVMGGIQSMSRSTYSKILPDTVDHASYFSFFDVTHKIGVVSGMFIYGIIEDITGNVRYSVTALLIFFLIGLYLLLRVPSKNLERIKSRI